MKKVWLAGWTAAAVALGAPQWAALAADAGGEFVLRGIGAQSCEDGLRMIQSDQRNAADLASWITGYVTALNRAIPGSYDLMPLTDITALVQIVGGMCANNPGTSMESVLNDVVSRLSKAKVVSVSPMIEARAGDKAVQVRAATLAAMQEQLIERKLFKGPADGQFGSKTESALKKYQKAQKIEQSGLPDSPTILSLLVESPANAPTAEEPEEKPKGKKGKKR